MSWRFPAEFEAMLSERGRRVLKGDDAEACGALHRSRFFSATDLLDPGQVERATALMVEAFSGMLHPLERELPDAYSFYNSGAELLPKVARMSSVEIVEDEPHSEALARTEEIGLRAMVESPGYLAFVTAIAGRELIGPAGLQALCYREGDYAGPHTDHHPLEPRMAMGYVDTHLTFCTPGVREQLIVYQQGHHLSQVQSIARSGTVTVYRLPFWHYTTPLQVDAALVETARRWLVLGTFFERRPA